MTNLPASLIEAARQAGMAMFELETNWDSQPADYQGAYYFNEVIERVIDAALAAALPNAEIRSAWFEGGWTAVIKVDEPGRYLVVPIGDET